MPQPTILLDSNLIIYAGKPSYQPVRDLIRQHQCAASVISLVEVLGYPNLSSKDISDYERLFHGLVILHVSSATIDHAIQLRRQRKMKLGDSLVAASAIEHDLQLATNDENDFHWIAGLRLTNPLCP